MRMIIKLGKHFIMAVICFFCSLYIYSETQNILILNSYNLEYRWTNDQYSGIMESLEKTNTEYSVYSEYLDWKRFPDESQIQKMYNLCKEKYQPISIDIIITTDDRALQFAIDNRKELFNDAPIVFSGVIKDSADKICSNHHKITGVYESLDIETTLHYALNIRPNYNEVYIINEETESGVASEKLMIEVIARIMPTASILSLSSMNISEIENFVQKISENSIILIGSYFVEKDGRSFTPDILTYRISKASKVPVYSVYLHLFGSGSIGGSLLDGKLMGKMAGTIARRILSGEKADSIEPISDTIFTTQFDYSVVKRFGISLSILPPNTVFINKELSFFEKYRLLSIVMTCTIILLLGFISILLSLNKKILRLAYFDPLTGLANKTKLFIEGDSVLARTKQGNKTALLYLGINNFKDLNDTYGHDFGNQVLKSVANRLKINLTKTIEIAHFSGDEFIVFIINSTNKEIMETAQNILTKLKKPLNFNEKSLQVSFSSGISLFPDHASDFKNLIKNANTAMHWAKDSDHIRNCYFTESMFLAIERRMLIETGLRSAIHNGEMYLLFQPQIHLQSEILHGLEALIRWIHPVMGSISPSEFISIAESTGQIESLGIFALKECLSFIKRNEEAGYTEFKVSINISIKQMRQEDFVLQILNLTKAAGVSPERFTIEMTESVLMEDAHAMQSKVRELCAAGYTLALDDFGSGYSSLTYLQYLPVHYIKMDKLFIDGMLNSEKTKKMIASIIHIAHDMGMEIIAEGVEHSKQKNFLLEKKCDYIQGYYYCKPITEIELHRMYPHIFRKTDIHA